MVVRVQRPIVLRAGLQEIGGKAEQVLVEEEVLELGRQAGVYNHGNPSVAHRSALSSCPKFSASASEVGLRECIL